MKRARVTRTARRSRTLMRIALRSALLCGFAVTSWSCGRNEKTEAVAAERHNADSGDSTAVPAGAKTATAAPTALLEPGALKTVAGAVVQGRTGPGNQPFEVARRTPHPPAFARQFGSVTLGIALRVRTPDLTQYPCTSCHMGSGMRASAQRVPDAHQNIQPVHPAETGATCRSCHAPENVELLAFQSGERTTIDHAYRLCGQCHTPQATAWAAGAHGKRLDGWQGRRVVLGCTACHDPHRPAIEQRTPFRAPQIERKRRSP